MMNKIIRFSVYKPWLVIFFSFLAIFAGIWAYLELPIDAVPDITNVQVQINTASPGFAPEEIEKNIGENNLILILSNGTCLGLWESEFVKEL